MTDDDLDRALFALPLEQTPAGLRDRILAATVYRVVAPAPFRTWELWVLAIAVAVVALVTYSITATVSDLGDRSVAVLTDALRALGLFAPITYAWFVAGVSAVWTISSLPLMPLARRKVYNR